MFTAAGLQDTKAYYYTFVLLPTVIAPEALLMIATVRKDRRVRYEMSQLTEE